MRGCLPRAFWGRDSDAFSPDVRNAEEREQLVLQIIQYCIHPRAKLSLPDAAFSYQFIKRMHTMDTPAFRTAIVFDKVRPGLPCSWIGADELALMQILNEQLGPVLYSCTENEARNYG